MITSQPERAQPGIPLSDTESSSSSSSYSLFWKHRTGQSRNLIKPCCNGLGSGVKRQASQEHQRARQPLHCSHRSNTAAPTASVRHSARNGSLQQSMHLLLNTKRPLLSRGDPPLASYKLASATRLRYALRYVHACMCKCICAYSCQRHQILNITLLKCLHILSVHSQKDSFGGRQVKALTQGP